MIICIRLLIIQTSMKSSFLLCLFMMLACGLLVATSETAPVYPDANQPLETHVDDLLSRRTLDEVFPSSMLNPKFAYYDPARKVRMAQADSFQIQISGSSRDIRLRGHFILATN